jgi:hypothetical protein
MVARFDFVSALYSIDSRKDYGEVRMRAIGYIEATQYALVFTMRGSALRVISLRKPVAGREDNMKKPNPELIDDENPEWTDEDFRKSVPFSNLPEALRTQLASEKHVSPDKESESNQPAA